MAKKRTTQELAQAMAEAHTDMNLFAAVERLMEGGLVSADAQPDDFKIIKLAQDAGRRAYRRYDAAQAMLSAKPL